MTLGKIKQIHSQNFFTRYPVLDEKGNAIGVFNMEIFYWKLITKKEQNWQKHIDKKVICFSPDEKLDKVLTRLQSSNRRLAIVKEEKRIIGIVTLHDVLGTLVGKIGEERETLLL